MAGNPGELNMTDAAAAASDDGCCTPRSLPVLYATGTHYQVGFEMGRTFRWQIRTFCERSTALNQWMLPYYASEEGRAVCEEYRAGIRATCPQYEDEIRGIADGSEIAYEKILLLNISAEVLGLLGKQASTTGCSDVMLNYVDKDGKQHSALAHNEDGDRSMVAFCFVVHYHVTPDRRLYPSLPEERFVSFCYPGRLAGNCMSTNQYGVVWSLNILFPKTIVRKKKAIYFLARTLATAESVEHAQEIVAKDPLGCSYGFSLNVSQRLHQQASIVMANVEVGPTTDVTRPVVHVKKLPLASDLKDGFSAHFNMYQRMPEVEQFTDDSSVRRERALRALPAAPGDLDSLLDFLGSADDPVFPVYRSGEPPDVFATFATAAFDLVEGTFSIYVDNPSREGALPIVTFPVLRQPPPTKT